MNVSKIDSEQADLRLAFSSSTAKDQTVDIDMTGQGYSYVKTDLGTLVIICAGVESYMDGQKVKLEVGNPLSATFRGFQLKVDSGPRRSFQYDQSNLRHQDIDFTDALLPGQWTDISFVVAPATPDQISHLSVGISLNTIALGRHTQQ